VILNSGLDDGVENGEGLRLSLLGDCRRGYEESQEQRNDSRRILAVGVNEMNLHQR
jgi:hypothetical protein